MKNDLRAKTHIPALNRLGACISYDDLMCIDTKWAGNILEKEMNTRLYHLMLNLAYFHKWLSIMEIMDKRATRNILQIPLNISIQRDLLVKRQ